ncbi:MAG: hypothetical protein DRP08_02700 [Candidatus Aenigmatarchaeota archaeon]|nr:MAG: hypothetical protein DRP08_02700 [Candidatus Aenigmarchaeota archaeon]
MEVSIVSSHNKSFKERIKMLVEVAILHFKIFERRLWDIILVLSLIEWILGSRKYELFVAYTRNKPIGFCLMRGCRIWQLGVLKKYRRRGVGSSLIPNYAKIVRTPKFRTDAIKFYEYLGFEKIGETKRSVWLGKVKVESRGGD